MAKSRKQESEGSLKAKKDDAVVKQRGVPRKCMFLCGSIKDSTPCPMNEEECIAWEYDKGNADIYRARVYRQKRSHLRSRDEQVSEMQRGKDEMDEFFRARACVIERAKAKLERGELASKPHASGPSTTHLRSRRTHAH